MKTEPSAMANLSLEQKTVALNWLFKLSLLNRKLCYKNQIFLKKFAFFKNCNIIHSIWSCYDIFKQIYFWACSFTFLLHSPETLLPLFIAFIILFSLLTHRPITSPWFLNTSVFPLSFLIFLAPIHFFSTVTT